MDLFDGSVKTPHQEFKAEIRSMIYKHLYRYSGKTRETIVSDIITTHMNMQDDDTCAMYQ